MLSATAMDPASATDAPPAVVEVMEHLCPVPHIPEVVSAVRRRARWVLTTWAIPAETADDALVVISELTTNAVVHALPPAMLRLSVTDHGGRRTLRVEVTDTGAAPHAHRPIEGMRPEECGRGLGIVAALSARHGIRSRGPAVTHWAELPAV
ncbi:ATP-binding protein [Peterkaempfera sp. SMS 1(5)a]|uniref:ATP-binding protein n=1 Tax=Peterkaempfera podocarpi TaxID=3232308 RepID=UPI0036725C27